MGRELKRVPLDFDWPIGKKWEGYVNPYYRPCPEEGRTCFNGENAAAVYLSHITSMLALIGDDAMRGETHPYCLQLPYLGEHPDWSVQPKEVRARMVALVRALCGSDGSPLGFTGSSHQILFNVLKSAGIVDSDAGNNAHRWLECPVCKGEGVDPEVKDKYESWVPVDPPKGEGFQLWETTSEGSPFSPVFRTLDALCSYAENHCSVFGDSMATSGQWRKMLEGGLVFHEEGNSVFV